MSGKGSWAQFGHAIVAPAHLGLVNKLFQALFSSPRWRGARAQTNQRPKGKGKGKATKGGSKRVQLGSPV